MSSILRHDSIKNKILHALPVHIFERISPYLEVVALQSGQIIHMPDTPVRKIYFIDDGLVALIKTMTDGRSVMVGTRGIESVTAPAVALGAVSTPIECIVQIPGRAYSVNSRQMRDLAAEIPALRNVILEYGRFAVSQLIQTSACNRLHALEQRYAKLLLIAHDNTPSDSFLLTHEFLAMTLGVQRPRISSLAGSFQREGFINYKHGRMTIRDRQELRKLSCECYEAGRQRMQVMFKLASA